MFLTEKSKKFIAKNCKRIIKKMDVPEKEIFMASTGVIEPLDENLKKNSISNFKFKQQTRKLVPSFKGNYDH